MHEWFSNIDAHENARDEWISFAERITTSRRQTKPRRIGLAQACRNRSTMPFLQNPMKLYGEIYVNNNISEPFFFVLEIF